MLKNSSILISGGTGSFGKTFVPLTLKKYNPKSNTYFRDPAYKEELDGIAINSRNYLVRKQKPRKNKSQSHNSTSPLQTIGGQIQHVRMSIRTCQLFIMTSTTTGL